jgi:hypothetical protein
MHVPAVEFCPPRQQHAIAVTCSVLLLGWLATTCPAESFCSALLGAELHRNHHRLQHPVSSQIAHLRPCAAV